MADVKPADEVITITLKDENDTVQTFKVKVKFAKVFNAWASKKGLDVKAYKFLFEGYQLKDDESPNSLKSGETMMDGDQIDVTKVQLGGGEGPW